MSDTKDTPRPKASAPPTRERESIRARLKTYDRLIALRSQLHAQLSPEGVTEQQREKVAQIAVGVLANEEIPQLYESRPSLELKLRGIEAAIQQTVEAIGREVAEQHGRDFGSLNFSLEPDAKPLPTGGEALVEGIANACELEDRREAATARRRDQQDRYQLALQEYNRLCFEHERQGDESIIASQKAKAEMADPDGLWCIEGQAGPLRLSGRVVGRATMDNRTGDLVAD